MSRVTVNIAPLSEGLLVRCDGCLGKGYATSGKPCTDCIGAGVRTPTMADLSKPFLAAFGALLVEMDEAAKRIPRGVVTMADLRTVDVRASLTSLTQRVATIEALLAAVKPRRRKP